MKILVTGGAGFIGSAVCRHLIRNTDHSVINLDRLTYAASLTSLDAIASSPRYRFVKLDICDGRGVVQLLETERPDAILHLAAESHVDRSIEGPAQFIQTNIVGTYQLLESARRYWSNLSLLARERFRFHHVSTDEVYGELPLDGGTFTEDTPYTPSSPYSASKAASDHLVRAWYRTYGLPTIVSNCSNNYGPYHFPEKLIPLAILNALEGKPVPVYGRGENVRDWLYVDDHARALERVLLRGKPGECYNVGGGNERTNIKVVRTICEALDVLRPRVTGPYSDLITFVTDRPGHDLRYAIDATKLKTELAWLPEETFETGILKTISWYLENEAWWRPIRERRYRGERLGVGVQV